MEKKLTNKDKIFVLEYLVDLDVERAAIVAGYSKSMAASKAYQWVRKGKPKPHVFEAIQKAFTKRADRIERTADEVLYRLWKMQDIDFADYSEKRQVKTLEMLMKHHGLFEKDNTQGGITEAMLQVMLAGMSAERAESVKKELIALALKKKKP